MSRRGYANLAHWITVARRRAQKGALPRAPRRRRRQACRAAPTLAGLPDCLALLAARMRRQPFETRVRPRDVAEDLVRHRSAPSIALELLYRAARCRAGRAGAARRALHRPADRGGRRRADARALAQAAAGHAHRHAAEATPVADCGLALEPNAEAHLRSRQRLAASYQADWLAATLALAGQLRVSRSTSCATNTREEIVPPGETPTSQLRKLTYAGVPRRFPQGLPEACRAQIEHELALIEQLQYEPYFLTVADIVHWARAQGILCQGRGSAANSLVCYCLGVTEVDPRARHAAVRAASSAPSATSRPTSTSISSTSAAKRSSSTSTRKYGRHRAALDRRWSSATGRARRCATSAARSASTCSASMRSPRASSGSTAARHQRRAAARERLRPRGADRAGCGPSSRSS